jgi:hypothetical protein
MKPLPKDKITENTYLKIQECITEDISLKFISTSQNNHIVRVYLNINVYS